MTLKSLSTIRVGGHYGLGVKSKASLKQNNELVA